MVRVSFFADGEMVSAIEHFRYNNCQKRMADAMTELLQKGLLLTKQEVEVGDVLEAKHAIVNAFNKGDEETRMEMLRLARNYRKRENVRYLHDQDDEKDVVYADVTELAAFIDLYLDANTTERKRAFKALGGTEAEFEQIMSESIEMSKGSVSNSI